MPFISQLQRFNVKHQHVRVMTVGRKAQDLGFSVNVNFVE